MTLYGLTNTFNLEIWTVTLDLANFSFLSRHWCAFARQVAEIKNIICNCRTFRSQLLHGFQNELPLFMKSATLGLLLSS